MCGGEGVIFFIIIFIFCVINCQHMIEQGGRGLKFLLDLRNLV